VAGVGGAGAGEGDEAKATIGAESLEV